jgi:gamma-glutamyltranspeptidase/glutathione hydrolase
MNRRNFLFGGAALPAFAQQIGDMVRPDAALTPGATHRAVMGRNGVVATADLHGSLAGIRTLMKGGNAIDAIVAAAATLNVTEPYMSGMAGFGGYMLIYMARERRVVALDLMGTSPAAATIDKFTEKDCDEGYLAPIVPGALAGWAAALDRYGTMSLGDVFEPAIELAEGGFVMTEYDAMATAATAEKLAKFPTTARVWLPNGKPPRTGQIVKQKDLARTFRRVALHGSEIFYKGEIAHEIVTFLREHGGLITLEDMSRYQVAWREPIRTDFQGHTVYGMPPGSCGMTMLQTLNIMDGYDLKGMDPYSPDFAHRWIEAVKLAFLDDDRYNTGKNVNIPLDRLISKSYAGQQRAKIQPRRVAAFPLPRLTHEGTTSLAAMDRWGNAVCFTQSLVSGFGSGVIAGNTGLLLNNGHRYGFVLDPKHVNSLAGGQRAKGVMSPTLVFQGDRLRLAVGAAGGYTIPQTVGQVIAKCVVYGMDIQKSIASPRMLINRGMGQVPVGNEAVTYLEPAFPEKTRAALAAIGHRLGTPGNAGGVQGVAVDPESGAFSGGSDPRRDGHPIAW